MNERIRAVSSKYIRQLLIASTLIFCGSAILIGCSSDSNEKEKAAAQLDLSVESLSSAGCLNLQTATESMRAFPGISQVREWTVNFEISDRNDKDKAVRRNMAAEAAFASFMIEQRAPSDFSQNQIIVTQDACNSVEFTDALQGKEMYVIVANEKANVLHLRSQDGLREKIFTLTGPREMEIETSGPKIDRCPEFSRAQAKTFRKRVWGLSEDLAKMPTEISTSLMRHIAIAVIEMPPVLSDMLASSDDYIRPTFDELMTLKMTSMNPKISECPYEAKPPAGDEPPPPENDEPVPTPTPEPAPAPAPAPAPVPTEPGTNPGSPEI